MPVVSCSCGLGMGVIVDATLRKGWLIVCSGCQQKYQEQQEYSLQEIARLREKVRLLTLSSELGRKKKDDFGDIFGDLFKKKGPFV